HHSTDHQRCPRHTCWTHEFLARKVQAAGHDLARAFAAFLGAFAGLKGFTACLVPGPGTRRAPGTFPIRGSLARTSSQARCAASSKSGASEGRTCQPVTFFPNT